MSPRRRIRPTKPKPYRRDSVDSSDPEYQLRHLGYAVICGKVGAEGSPYALAREQLREDFVRRGEAMRRAGCSAEAQLSRLRIFVWDRLAAIDHLAREGKHPAPPARHITTRRGGEDETPDV